MDRSNPANQLPLSLVSGATTRKPTPVLLLAIQLQDKLLKHRAGFHGLHAAIRSSGTKCRSVYPSQSLGDAAGIQTCRFPSVSPLTSQVLGPLVARVLSAKFEEPTASVSSPIDDVIVDTFCGPWYLLTLSLPSLLARVLSTEFGSRRLMRSPLHRTLQFAPCSTPASPGAY